MLKNKFQKGFTIVELLIVIVVIGILAALVLNTFSGIQARARDTERQTDTNSLATQLEVYYNNNGGYPILTGQLDTDSWVTANLKGIDLNALRAPSVTTNSMNNSATPDANHYGYVTTDSTGASCTTAPCAKFKLYWHKEADNTTQEKDSLN